MKAGEDGAPAEALLDTSALIEVLDKERLDPLPAQPYLSTNRHDRHKKDRRFHKERMEEALIAFPITDDVAEMAADIFAQLKKTGAAVSENDIYIAATAVAHGLPLLIKDKDWIPRRPAST